MRATSAAVVSGAKKSPSPQGEGRDEGEVRRVRIKWTHTSPGRPWCVECADRPIREASRG